jgi:hypothetical protein
MPRLEHSIPYQSRKNKPEQHMGDVEGDLFQIARRQPDGRETR